MAEHNAQFELYYAGDWHPAPVLNTSDKIKFMRGSKTPGNDTEPAAGTLTLDNGSGAYAPRSVAGPLYGLIGQNTPGRIRVDDDGSPEHTDDFARSASSSWGFTPTGAGWSLAWSAGGVTNFDVTGGVGRMAVTAVASYSITYLDDVSADDPDVTVTVNLPLATGGDLETGPLLGGLTLSTYYMLRAVVKTSNAIDLKIINVVDLSETTLATVSSGLTHAAATPLKLRGQIADGRVRFKAWQGSVQPSTWQADVAAQTIYRGWVGLRSGRAAGNTNTTTPQFTYDDFSVSYNNARMTGEVAAWKPQRPVKGSGYTPIEFAGVLRRIGRGDDPIQSALRRYYRKNAVQPVSYWPLEGAAKATTAYDDIHNTPTGLDGVSGAAGYAGAVQFGEAYLSAGSAQVANLAGSWLLSMLLPLDQFTATGQVTYQWHANFGTTVRTGALAALKTSISFDDTQPRYMQWQVWTFDDGTIQVKELEFANHILVAGPTTVHSAVDIATPFDGTPRAYQLNLAASGGTDVAWALYLNGATVASGTYTPGFSGAMNARPYAMQSFSEAPNDNPTAFGHVAVFNQAIAVGDGSTDAMRGHISETAADRFARLLAEEDITATIVGTPSESVPMGPQGTGAFLDQLDEIATTDDASIFETRSMLGLTMRTGSSKLNQDPALTLNYLGQIEPPLVPVFGDAGIRNDVEARNPDGSTGRVVQETGPRNVQAPGTDPQGVGRYKTSPAVNTATVAQLVDEAGWRVNLGTYDGTWYAEVTADLDAAPGLVASVNALDIGDVVAIANLPVDEALDTVEGIIIGIGEDCPPKRRLVTFYLIPNTPYRVGQLASATGDTDPIVGRWAETTDTSSTTTGVVAAGAASFTVATSVGPLWTTDSDDFPMDVVVGGQRIGVSGIVSAINANPFLETDAADWFSVSNAGVFRDTAVPHEGTASLLVVPDGVTSGPGARTSSYPVVPGQTYGFAAWVRVSSGGSGDRSVGINWRTAADANLSMSLQTQTPTPTVWTFYSGTAVAPVGAALARLVVTGTGVLAAANTWRVDEARLDDFATQQFTVDPTGRQVQYPIASGAPVTVFQPVILAM